MIFDPSSDFALFDGANVAALARADGSESEDVSTIQRWVSSYEAEKSDGKYTTSDAVFHISGVDLDGSPIVGDKITKDSTVWRVLGTRWESLTQRWELISRALKILDSLITIQVATFTKSEDGIQEETWADETVDLSAAFSRVSDEDSEERRIRKSKPKFEAYLSQTIEPKNRRVIHNGTTYRITGAENSDSISDLFVLRLEEWPR